MSTNKRERDVAPPPSPSNMQTDDDEEVKSPARNKVFQGTHIMDEDKQAFPTMEDVKKMEDEARQRRVDEREAKKAAEAARVKLQKETGRQVTRKDFAQMTSEDIEAFRKEWVPVERGRSRQKAAATGGDRSKSAPRRRSKSVTNKKKAKSASGRRSMSPSTARNALKKKSSRSKSVDTATSSKKDAENSDASAGSKRRATEKPAMETPDAKTASFADGTLNNEGKTAVTKEKLKAEKAAKKGQTYVSKVKVAEKKSWPHRTYIFWTMKVSKTPNTCAVVYKRHADMFKILQACDPTCAIADHMNEKSKPLRSPGEFPKPGVIGEHAKYQRFFTLDNEQEWSFDNKIKANQPRSMAGSFILLSDKDPHDIFKFSRVDLNNGVEALYRVKPLQELYTVVGMALMGVHGNCWTDAVTLAFRNTLREAETDLFQMKNDFYSGLSTTYDSRCDSLDENWEKVDFPEIVGVRTYPKGGGFEKSTAGEDTSWKMAIHFEYALCHHARVKAALAEAEKRGFIDKMFGKQAMVSLIVQDPRDVAGKQAFREAIPDHQCINRSVGNVLVPGIVDLDKQVSLYFETAAEGRFRTSKMTSLRDILRKIYVKLGDKKISVFLYAFATPAGYQQLWFWNTVPAIREFINNVSRNLPGYIWHRCDQWGWDLSTLSRLFRLSMDSDTAVSAMNSRWSAKKQRVIEVAMGSEAAKMLNFGKSPFILKPGETELAPARREKAKITGSNLQAGQYGGKNEDDLHSIGDESNAETVFKAAEESSDEESDGISEYGDDEDMGDEIASEDEDTVGGEEESESDEELSDVSMDGEAESNCSTKAGRMTVDEASAVSDDDSGFSTVDGRAKASRASLDDLKMGGRKVRGDDDDPSARIEELMAEQKAAHEKQLEDMRREFEARLQAAMSTPSTQPTASQAPGSHPKKKDDDSVESMGDKVQTTYNEQQSEASNSTKKVTDESTNASLGADGEGNTAGTTSQDADATGALAGQV